MLRGLYDKVVELSKGKHALPVLATVSERRRARAASGTAGGSVVSQFDYPRA